MNILYATDGSSGACIAGRLLASLPLTADTQVTVLGAIHHDHFTESIVFADTALHEHRHALGVAERCAEAGEALLSPCGCHVVRCLGGEDAALEILRRADADSTDLIVLGCRNRHGVERVLLGSVSEHVARYAHTSVLVARTDQLRRILVAVDGSASSEHALDALARLPLPDGASLTLLYVSSGHERESPALRLPVLVDQMPAAEPVAELPGIAEQIVGHAAQHLHAFGRRAEVRIGSGHPAEQIVEVARETEADLVVVGAANRSVLGRLIVGSVSARVLGQAPCSVLIARPLAATAYLPVRASEIAGARA
jgi:nucleotide-binding universal stress UspA family protein